MSDAPSRASLARAAVAPVLAVVLALGTALLALSSLRPPEPVPASAAEDRFSAERAMRYVEVLASSPRPTGSVGNLRAQEALVEWLEELGVEVEVHAVTVADHRDAGEARGARLGNVVARVEGTDPTGTVLLMSHHDSVPIGPGAADAASGVATLLETLRVLRTGPPPRNDLVFLFTDGEEWGLLGARAFLAQHPGAEDVRAVLNFEARGAAGPSILFETGPVDAPLMRRVGAALPHPVAASYSYDVYRRLPNDTDFTVFKRAGRAGFNFAFIEDFPAYHSAHDTAERLDRGSLQHHGSNAVALARLLGEMNLEALPEEGTAVYFTLPGIGLVVYPTGWTLPLAVLAALVTLGLLGAGLWRGRGAGTISGGLRAGRLLAGVVMVPAVFVLTVVAVYLAGSAWQEGFDLEIGNVGAPGWYLLGWVFLALGLVAAGAAAMARRPGRLHLFAGAAAWWAVLVVFAAVALPSSSYLFLWPLVFALPPLGLLVLRRRQEDGEIPPSPEWEGRRPLPAEDLHPLRGPGFAVPALLLLALVVALLLWVPTLALMGAALALGGTVVLALGAALLAVLLVPAWLPGGSRWRWAFPAAAAALGLGLVVITTLAAGHGPERPASHTLLYVLDTESGEALWVSWDDAPDAWTGHFLDGAERRKLEGYTLWFEEVLAAPAPQLPLQTPRIERLPADGSGTVGLRVFPPPGAEELRLALTARPAPPEGEAGPDLSSPDLPSADRLRLELLRLDGQPVAPPEGAAPDTPPEKLEVRFYAPPAEGLDLVLAVAPAPGGGTAGETTPADDATTEMAPEATADLEATAGNGSVPAAPGGALIPVIEVDAIAHHYGLPTLDGQPLPPRPPELQPRRFSATDRVLVRSHATLPPAPRPVPPEPAAEAVPAGEPAPVQAAGTTGG